MQLILFSAAKVLVIPDPRETREMLDHLAQQDQRVNLNYVLGIDLVKKEGFKFEKLLCTLS